jgi:lantibiotic biosynthesis protein
MVGSVRCSKLMANARLIALDLAERLQSAPLRARAVELSVQQTAYPQAERWCAFSLAKGEAGLALMYGYFDRCFPGEGWDQVAHNLLITAAKDIEGRSQIPLGMFSGLSGLAFAVAFLSQQGMRYQRLLATLEATLLPKVIALAQQVERRHGLPVRNFDLISGLSGMGAYLLCRQQQPEAEVALKRTLQVLVALSTTERQGIPAWFTPPHLLPSQTQHRHPAGNLNCGLAHGIPGPLALLALAWRAGVRVSGQEEAIEKIVRWLLVHRLDDTWGINWPTTVPIASATTSATSRAAWCYGSPGIARALWLAGVALQKQEFCTQAIEAMAAVYRRPLAERRIASPTFCHGVAGLLQVTLRFEHDTGLSLFSEAAETLGEQLTTLYEQTSLLGYRCLEPGSKGVDRQGLLDGATGIGIVLLAFATDVEPAWDRLFLIS